MSGQGQMDKGSGVLQECNQNIDVILQIPHTGVQY